MFRNKSSLAVILLFIILTSLFSCTDVYRIKKRQGIVVFRVPAKALVYIDGKLMGIGAEINRKPISLSKGSHTLMILDNDYYPYYSTFKLDPGDLLKRRIKVYRKLDE
jgi:hypothetical protein